MSLREQLIAMNACEEAVAWVGDRTLEQAWQECRCSDWMGWLLNKLKLDTRAAAADIAESVWHLVEPELQLACAWAIDCARRGADDDERDAALAAAAAAAEAAGAAAWAAAGAAARDAAGAAAWSAADAAAAAADAAADAAGDAAWAAAGDAQRALNCQIIREHYSWRQIDAALKEPRT